MTSHPQDARTWQRPDDPARPTSASLVDPEDDLPSSTYGGDFETTAIPRWDADKGAPAPPVFNLMNDPEPLPYVQPHAGPPVVPYGPTEIGPDADDRVKAARRRGTQDLGLMLLRVGLGVLLVGHGLQKAFGWWGGPGLGGFQDSLTEVGYQHANILTYVGAVAQIGAGVLLVLGLFTPIAAAVALAYLINSLLAGVASQSEGFPFFLPGGFEFHVTLIVIAAALILTGPGRYGFDAGRGWARRPFVGSVVALLLGIGLGVAMWVLLNGANPLA
ncbi:membrane protein [Mycolicibacterium litorale]|uniref:Membrane protein n=1 Tax=Mycolicibacterium litorale TaxID=758802 RepID=A0A6S6P282_9MYCO|nr:DoxX family protein [Mycolicibacterium litorale]BCI52555.1 membrane protein [Mycolicibacterium litorale]